MLTLAWRLSCGSATDRRPPETSNRTSNRCSSPACAWTGAQNSAATRRGERRMLISARQHPGFALPLGPRARPRGEVGDGAGTVGIDETHQAEGDITGRRRHLDVQAVAAVHDARAGGGGKGVTSGGRYGRG